MRVQSFIIQFEMASLISLRPRLEKKVIRLSQCELDHEDAFFIILDRLCGLVYRKSYHGILGKAQNLVYNLPKIVEIQIPKDLYERAEHRMKKHLLNIVRHVDSKSNPKTFCQLVLDSAGSG